MLRVWEFWSKFKGYILVFIGVFTFCFSLIQSVINYIIRLRVSNIPRPNFPIGQVDENGYTQVPTTPGVPEPAKVPQGVEPSSSTSISSTSPLHRVDEPVKPEDKPVVKDEKGNVVPDISTGDLLDKVGNALNGK